MNKVGTNMYNQSDINPNVWVKLTNADGFADDCELRGTTTLPSDLGLFSRGCQLKIEDNATLYLNSAADGLFPTWVQIGGSGIGGTIADGQIAFGAFMQPNTIAGTDDLKWDGTTFTIGTNVYAIQSNNGQSTQNVTNATVSIIGMGNPDTQPTFVFNDNGYRSILTTIVDTSNGNNRRAQVAVYPSNAALYFDVNDDPNDTLHRYVSVDSEAVKIGSYEVGGTNRTSGASYGEISSSMSYGATGIVTRSVVVDATGAYFTSNDVFPFVKLLGIDIASKKAVTNYGERHKVKRTNNDVDYTVLDSDFIIAVANTGAPVTVTLPPLPANGDMYVIKDGYGTASTHNITIDANGNMIQNNATYTISSNYGGITIVWSDVLSVWLITSTV